MLSSYNTIINKGNKRISLGTTMRVTAVYAIRHVLKPETTKRNERNETTETSETKPPKRAKPLKQAKPPKQVK